MEVSGELYELIARAGPIADDAQQWRSPAVLRSWLDGVYEDPKIPSSLMRERAGIFRRLSDEVFPLAFFGAAFLDLVRAREEDIRLLPVLGSQNFDALMFWADWRDDTAIRLEIVTAYPDGEQEALLRESISQMRFASPNSTYRRERRGGPVRIENDRITTTAFGAMRKQLSAVKRAFDSKNIRSRNYDDGTWLVISADDSQIYSAEALSEFKDEMSQYMNQEKTQFSKVFIVGGKNGLLSCAAR